MPDKSFHMLFIIFLLDFAFDTNTRFTKTNFREFSILFNKMPPDCEEKLFKYSHKSTKNI